MRAMAGDRCIGFTIGVMRQGLSAIVGRALVGVTSLENLELKNTYVQTKCKTCGQLPRRSPPQNKSGHLWFEQIAQALNDAGYTVNSKEVLMLDVPFTKDTVKEHIFKRIAQAMFPDKKSSAELTKMEWSEVVETMNEQLGTRTGVYVPYPDD